MANRPKYKETPTPQWQTDRDSHEANMYDASRLAQSSISKLTGTRKEFQDQVQREAEKGMLIRRANAPSIHTGEPSKKLNTTMGGSRPYSYSVNGEQHSGDIQEVSKEEFDKLRKGK